MKRGRSNPDSFNPYTVKRASENVKPLNATELLMKSAAASHKGKSAYGFTTMSSEVGLTLCCSCNKMAAPRMNSDYRCSFCEKQFCEECSRKCAECGYVFCSNCASVVYEGRYEYSLCISCNSNHRHRK